MIIDSETKELIYRSYEKTLDLDLACKKLRITDEAKDLLLKDENFKARLDYAEATQKEQLLESLFDLSKKAKNDAVRFNALMEIIKTYYPERFGKDKISEEVQKVVLYLPENNRGTKA